GAPDVAQALLAAQTHLLTGLADADLPAVVAATTPGNDASTGILRTVRGDRAFDRLSTTDRLQEPDGPLLAVLALIEQTRGGAGSSGTTSDAEERLPELPAPQGLDRAGEGPAPASADAAAQPSDGGGEG